MAEKMDKSALASVMRAIERFVYADGHVDIAEAKALIGLVTPFAANDPDLERFRKLLVAVAADGVVDAEESVAIAAAIQVLKEKFAAAGAIYDARTLGLPKMGLLGVQHLFAMFGATVLVPILTGLNISTTLLFAGLGTLLFHFITKRNVPAFLGSSFAFLPGYFAMAAMKGGVWEGLTKPQLLAYASVGVAVSALVYLVVAGIVKGCGVQRVMRFFPPVVTGPIIIGIGLVLAPVALNSAQTCWPVALAGVVAVLVASCFGRGMVRIIPILIGVVTSYLAAVILGNLCGMEGASVNFSEISKAAWIGIPVHWNETAMSVFSNPGDNLGRIISAIAIIVPLVAATIMEHVGDVSAIGSTIHRNLFKDPGLHRTLMGDGLATFVAAVFGAPANTTYGENTGVLSLSKVYDSRVIRIAAVLAILLSFCPKFAAVIQTLPGATVGGVSLVLYGMISAVGVRNLVEHQVDFSKARNMLICAITIVCALGISFAAGLGCVADPDHPFAGHNGAISFSVCGVNLSLSGLAVGALLGILLNAILPGKDYAFSSTEPNMKEPVRFGGLKQ